MLRVLALSAATLAVVEGAGLHFDLKLTVTDTSKFGKTQTKSNTAIKLAIVKHFDGLEDNMVSLWDEPAKPAPTPAPSGTPAPTSAPTSGKTAAPTPAPVADNSTETTKAPVPTEAPTVAPTPAATLAPTPSDDSGNETVDEKMNETANETETDRRLADAGVVSIPVYLHDLPAKMKIDGKAMESDALMASINAELKTAYDITTDMVTKLDAELEKKGSDTSAAWAAMRTPLLAGLGASLVLLSL